VNMRAETNVKQTAPGRLEQVRGLLNSWEIPKSTQVETDHLPRLVENPRAWSSRFPGIPAPLFGQSTVRRLRRLRDELRAMVEAREVNESWVNKELGTIGVRPIVTTDGEAPRVVHLGPARGDPRASFLAIVIDAISDGTWLRLRMWPGCKWISYDWTRNRTKVWCRPYAGSPRPPSVWFDSKGPAIQRAPAGPMTICALGSPSSSGPVSGCSDVATVDAGAGNRR
jgi:hypothetical protein